MLGNRHNSHLRIDKGKIDRYKTKYETEGSLRKQDIVGCAEKLDMDRIVDKCDFEEEGDENTDRDIHREIIDFDGSVKKYGELQNRNGISICFPKCQQNKRHRYVKGSKQKIHFARFCPGSAEIMDDRIDPFCLK